MLINENLVAISLDAKTKEDVISELLKLAEKEGKITSVEEFKKCVLEREKTYTTGVGNGIAIPHGKSEAVKEAMIVFGKSERGIEWNSLDGKPVNMVFLLGIPHDNANELHLKVLSQLSRKLMDNEFVEKLKNAKTRKEVLDALGDIRIN